MRDRRSVELRSQPAPPPGVRSDLQELVDEQTALRRVAELVARGAPQSVVLEAIAAEAYTLLGVDLTGLMRSEDDGSSTIVALHGVSPGATVGQRISFLSDGVVERVLRTGRPARVDSFTDVSGVSAARARQAGVAAAAGAPILVEGRLWGVIAAMTRSGAVSPQLERRLAQFAETAAMAVAAAQAADDLRSLAEEQAALRRVAELAAAGAAPDRVLAAVTDEASALLGGGYMSLMRFAQDGSHAVVVALTGDYAPMGYRFPIDGESIAARILRHGHPERIDDYTGVPGTDLVTELGLRAAVGVPVLVDGSLWGMLSASSVDVPLPAGTERRLAQFAGIAGASISSAQARADLRGLADEQAALRRVAELVAHGAGGTELFEAVAIEAAGLIDDEATTLVRYDGDRSFTILATCGGPAPVGTRVKVAPDDTGTLAEMLRTHRPARLDDYRRTPGPLFSRDTFGVGSSVSIPIIVEERLWGALGTLTDGRRLPPETEGRLQQFAQLVAAALANRQARTEVQQLADEQAALRRVAERVAQGVAPQEVFDLVAREASRLLGDAAASLVRHEPGGAETVVAASGTLGGGPGVAAVAVPILVEGRAWGELSVRPLARPPLGTEERLGQFADLAAASVANADHRAQLTASRARVVATADEARRRLQRDVHDGAQQRLVHTVITLKLAKAALARDASPAKLVDEALYHAERATGDLRDVVHGILPTSLSHGGLRAGVQALVSDLPMLVDVHVTAPRFATETETTAYFIVAEALTNVVKHAGADRARVDVRVQDGSVLIEVGDDGAGGADPARGSGLTGLSDRVAASEGTLDISSPPGAGTVVRARLPLAGR